MPEMKETVRTYGLRGKGYRLRDNATIKSMKAVHMLAAIAWGGGAFSMQALGFLGRSLPPGPDRDFVGLCSHFVDTWVVIPGLAGCVLTGLFYSCLTAIGFFRFAWIGYKWLIACSAGFWGTFFWGPWGAEITQFLQPYGLDGFMRMMRWFVLPENAWTAILQTAIVLSVCLVSVYRPLSFRFWQKDLEEKDIRRRTRAVRDMDKSAALRSPLDNVQVQLLYDTWLGEPIGPQANAHLHTRFRDKSARIRKLQIAGLYPQEIFKPAPKQRNAAAPEETPATPRQCRADAEARDS